MPASTRRCPARASPPRNSTPLWKDACALLARGVTLGAIVTVDGAVPGRGRYRERVNIFGRDACPRCARAIRLIVMGERKAYACEACQKRPRRVTGKA